MKTLEDFKREADTFNDELIYEVEMIAAGFPDNYIFAPYEDEDEPPIVVMLNGLRARAYILKGLKNEKLILYNPITQKTRRVPYNSPQIISLLPVLKALKQQYATMTQQHGITILTAEEALSRLKNGEEIMVKPYDDDHTTFTGCDMENQFCNDETDEEILEWLKEKPYLEIWP